MVREMEGNVGEGDRRGIVRWQEDIEQLVHNVLMITGLCCKLVRENQSGGFLSRCIPKGS